jgi:hypothetical protein
VNPLDILSWSVVHQADGSWAVVDNNGNVVKTLIGPPAGTGHIEQQPDGSYAVVWSDTGQTTTLDPSATSTGTPVPATSSSSSGGDSGTAPFLPEALKWLAALFLLWVILTALAEHGDPNAHNIGRALAGLLLLGSLYYLGPGAMSNIKNLWTQTNTSAPVQGPNPVSGA